MRDIGLAKLEKELSEFPEIKLQLSSVFKLTINIELPIFILLNIPPTFIFVEAAPELYTDFTWLV